jgi:hypothetical protein
MVAMRELIRGWHRAGLLAILVAAVSPSGLCAQSGSAGGSIGDENRSLSGPRHEADRPAEEAAPVSPGGPNNSFDGVWAFTSAGCPHTGTLPAIITGGRIVVQGGAGQVDPDGALHSVGAGNGMTVTAVGQLSGNTGAGSFKRSDGCVGSWIAIKQ